MSENEPATAAEQITPEESFWVNVMRLNRAEKRKEITWRRSIGRFGGGWNWKLGVQAGDRTVIVNLLVASVRLYLKKRTTDA